MLACDFLTVETAFLQRISTAPPASCRLSAKTRHASLPETHKLRKQPAHSCQNGPTEWTYSPTVKPQQQESSRGRDERPAHSYDDIASATNAKKLAPKVPVRTQIREFRLEDANEALQTCARANYMAPPF